MCSYAFFVHRKFFQKKFPRNEKKQTMTRSKICLTSFISDKPHKNRFILRKSPSEPQKTLQKQSLFCRIMPAKQAFELDCPKYLRNRLNPNVAFVHALNRINNSFQELPAKHTVNHAVIHRHRNIAHTTHCYNVLPVKFADNGTFFDCA